ncbi:hypothetical protein, partial [Terrilactibacillus laevilacticus]|uniref:hypothetical protein n=1 Tax=Terrilactibacillus laevilacticus TaxID=1380157 RepID=UPI001C6402D1
ISKSEILHMGVVCSFLGLLGIKWKYLKIKIGIDSPAYLFFRSSFRKTTQFLQLMGNSLLKN